VNILVHIQKGIAQNVNGFLLGATSSAGYGYMVG
jgi:hypothetical protein